MSAVLSAVLFVQSFPLSKAQSVPFPDMQNTWYRYTEAVDALVERGIISGYPDGTFRPDDPINRAELLKIVFKGNTITTPERRCFSDVNPDTWYAPYICTAKRRGIVDGYPDGTYKPEQTVNFAEAIKIILRAYGREITEPQRGDWFAPYVLELDEDGILPSHSFIPWSELTRVRAADLLWRVLTYDEEGEQFNYSPGCGHKAVQKPSSVMVDGERRSFLLTVPTRYVEHDPVPLVIAFHGRTNSNEEVRSYYRLDREMTDAIIAYPAGVENGNGSFGWVDAGDTPRSFRDIAFFDTLVKKLADTYCIDMDRIFVVGHSLGGWFANSLACVRGDVIRGSVSVGSSSVITNCRGPSAAMIIHNPDDRLAPFSGSEQNRLQRVEVNACNWDLIAASPRSFNCVDHGACTENPVRFCPHEIDIDSRGRYYPHNWPRETGTHIAEFFRSLQ